MPSESDKKIEELLKAYAQKRRQQAGPPLELHPATRRLLQAEVANRRKSTGGKAPSFFELLIQFWPRVAFAATIVVGLAAVLWVVSNKPAAEQQLAQNSKRPAEDSFDR